MSEPGGVDYQQGDYMPDLGELQQQPDDDVPPLKVSVVGEVLAHRLPSRELVMATVRLKNDSAVKVLPDDLRRIRLTLMPVLASGSTSTNIQLAATKEEMDGGRWALWPARPPGSAPNTQLVLETTRAVWAKLPASDAAVCDLSYIAEYWAD